MTEFARPDAPVAPFEAEQASAHTPSQVREAIAHWVAQDRMDLAQALAAAGVALYPDSQDILAMMALLAEVEGDWAQAQQSLEHLIEVQGEQATAEAFHHLVRVMRCRQAYYPALRTVQRGLALHPQQASLQQAHDELNALLETPEVKALALTN